MSNSGVLDIFGEFLNSMQNNSFDDDWMQHARIISGLHLCDNAIGVRTMIEILDRINANCHSRGGVGEIVWKLTGVDISSGVESLALNMQFTGSRGERAHAICYLRDDEDPVIAGVDSDDRIFESIPVSSCTWTTNGGGYGEYADTSEGDDTTQWYRLEYTGLDANNQYICPNTTTYAQNAIA